MATATVHLDEKSLVAHAVASMSLPSDITFMRVDDYEDWTGELSYRVYLRAPASDYPSSAQLDDRLRVRTAVHELARRISLEKFLYVEFIGDASTV